MNLVRKAVTPALGVHALAHHISEMTVTQLAEEAWCCTRIIHALLNVLHPCITANTV